MRNKKTIALAMAAATVAPMAVPAFAAEIEAYVVTPEQTGQNVDLRKVNGRAIKYVAKESLDEEMRALEIANKNPKVVFVDVDSTTGKHGDAIVEYDQSYNADDVATEKEKLQKIKDFIEYANSKDTIDASTKEKLYTVTTEVREYSISGTTANPSVLTVTVRENVKTNGSKFNSYTYTFTNYDTKFQLGEEVIVKNLNLDLSGTGASLKHNEYKKFRAFEYSLKQAVKQHGLVVTTTKITTQRNKGYKVNIYKKDKTTKVGEVFIKTNADYKLDSALSKKYNHVSLDNDFVGHWAEENIVNAMLNGIVSTSSTFRPKEAITRAEFTSVIYNTLNHRGLLTSDGKIDAKDRLSNDNLNIRFTDVSENDWFATPIMELAKAGYINGNPDGTFKPNAPITRQEAAKIMSDVIYKTTKETYKKDSNGKKLNVDIVTQFNDDSTIASWADESVQALVKQNVKGNILNTKVEGTVISGDAGKNTFRGKDSISRAEAIIMAERAGLAAKAGAWK